METPTCIACQQTLALHIQSYGSTDYSLWFCEKCRLNHTVPLPSEAELSNYYQGFLFNIPTGAQAEQWEQNLRCNVRRMIGQLIQNYGVAGCRGRALDFGGGVGITASEFSRLGFESTLYDLDDKACDYARNRFENEIAILQGENVEIPDSSYDLIYSSQVIEHLTDPVEHFRFLAKKLRNGGTLVVTTPNQRSSEYVFRLKWLRYYLGKCKSPRALHKVQSFLTQKWLNFDPPRHLFGFNKHNLPLLAEKAGLSKLACFSEFGHRSIFNTPRRQPDWHAGWKPIPSQMYEKLGLKLISALNLGVFEGNNLVYIGRKPTPEPVSPKN